jgi:hypothetical protein
MAGPMVEGYQPDDGADHPECRGGIANRLVDALAFIEAFKVLVSFQLEGFLDKGRIVAIGYKLRAFLEERVFDLQIVECQGAIAPHHLGEFRDLVDHFHGIGLLVGERDPATQNKRLKHVLQRKTYDRCGKATADHDQHGRYVDKCADIAPVQNCECYDDRPGDNAGNCCDIHVSPDAPVPAIPGKAVP